MSLPNCSMAGGVYVTSQVAAVDADTSIVPVLASIVNPLGVDVNAPPASAVIVAAGSLPSVQKAVVPPQLKPTAGTAIVMLCVDVCAHAFDDVVYVTS